MQTRRELLTGAITAAFLGGSACFAKPLLRGGIAGLIVDLVGPGSIGRRSLTCGSILLLLLFAVSHLAFALDADRTIAQFYHTAWTIEDGAPSGMYRLAQTKDGYLWIGTFNGLFRFDGVRFERYQPERGDQFPSQGISALLATPDGGLWIGFVTGGTTFLENGRGHTEKPRGYKYGGREGLPSSTVNEFALDREGAVWAGTYRGLFRFTQSRWEKVGTEWGFFSAGAKGLFVDNQGKLWVNANTDLYCLSPGGHVFEMRKVPYQWIIRQTPDGTFWLSESQKGVHAVSGPLGETYDRSKADLRMPVAGTLLVDREGSFWMSLTPGDGVGRISRPERLPGQTIDSTSSLIQKFTDRNGLTDNVVVDMLEDHEGNVWIATSGGLDRLRRKNVLERPLPSKTINYSPFLVTDRKGIVWEGSAGSIRTAANDGVSVREGLRLAPPFWFPDWPLLTSGWVDFEGAFWIGGPGTLTRWIGGRLEKIQFPDKDLAASHMDVESITGDRAGDLWVSIQQGGVYHRHNGVWEPYGNTLGLPKSLAAILWADFTNRLWFGYMTNQIALVDGNRVRIFSAPDGLHVGNVLDIGGHGDHIWAAGQFGLTLFNGNKFHTIAGEADPDFRGINGVVETAAGDFWLNMETGVARIAAAEIANRLRDPQHTLQYDLFDFRDGVRGAIAPLKPVPSAVEAGDGRVWISRSNGVYWIDPARIYKNPIPPPVTIEAIYEGNRRFSAFEAARLPKLPQNVRIEYTALSLSIPERVRFRYQLEGYDKGWQDVGTRRAAYYPKLPPGHFRFHVIACNNDGVWNQTGAVTEIVVPRAFYQTAWFEAACFLAGFALLWGLYRYRLHQIAHEFNVRLEERVSERTRLARDLHDTLLQSFHGLMLHFEGVNKLLSDGKAKEQMETALELADQAIIEGRRAVYDLRSSATTTNELSEALKAVGNELSTDDGAEFGLVLEGPPKDLHPIIRDELYRISREALRNAFEHAHARHIEAELNYGERVFRLRIRDDGEGIPAAILEQGRPGHYGLSGMRERVRQVGGDLNIWSRTGGGTEIDLSLPGSIAYVTSPRRSRLRVFGKKGG